MRGRNPAFEKLLGHARALFSNINLDLGKRTTTHATAPFFKYKIRPQKETYSHTNATAPFSNMKIDLEKRPTDRHTQGRLPSCVNEWCCMLHMNVWHFTHGYTFHTWMCDISHVDTHFTHECTFSDVVYVAHECVTWEIHLQRELFMWHDAFSHMNAHSSMNQSYENICITWMRHVAQKCVMSHMNKSRCK